MFALLREELPSGAGPQRAGPPGAGARLPGPPLLPGDPAVGLQVKAHKERKKDKKGKKVRSWRPWRGRSPRQLFFSLESTGSFMRKSPCSYDGSWE